MGKISGKQFQAILERQLENNLEELRVVMKMNIWVRAILSTCLLNGTNYFVAIFFAFKIVLDHQINFS